MKRFFDFKCPNGHVTEHYIETDVKEIQCDVCEENAKRIISAVRCHLPPNSGFPGRDMRWVRDHEQGAKQKR